MNIQDDLTGDSGRHPAYLGAPGSAVPSHFVKSTAFFRKVEAIHFPIPDLVNLGAKGVADLFFKPLEYLAGFVHGFLVLLPIFHSFPSHQAANSHDGSGEGTAGFPLAGHAPGQGGSGFKNIGASHSQLFLQSCKNGLRSAEIIHVAFQG